MQKRLLILGATSDIARACALRFAKEGFDLILTARDPEALSRDAADLSIRYGVAVSCEALDVTAFDTHEEFVANLEPKPDGVLSVVGYLGDQERAQKEFSEAKKIVETNYLGVVSLFERFAAIFERRGTGFLIGVSSVAGDRGRQSNYLYGSAKAGLSAYLSGLRHRLYKKGIPVLTVKPGFVRTKMTAGMDLPEKLVAEPAEVAEDIFKAYRKRCSTLYTKWFWRFIMLIIIHLPEPIFKRTNL